MDKFTKIKDYMDYEIIEREGYVVVKVITYPRDPEYGIRKVIHYLPSTLILEDRKDLTR